MTFYHMCKSSSVFDKDRRFHGDLGKKPCEEMEKRLQRELALEDSLLGKFFDKLFKTLTTGAERGYKRIKASSLSK